MWLASKIPLPLVTKKQGATLCMVAGADDGINGNDEHHMLPPHLQRRS
jgi:hypothetical protein